MYNNNIKCKIHTYTIDNLCLIRNCQIRKEKVHRTSGQTN